jgi:very-short-patch-repair endonuclease
VNIAELLRTGVDHHSLAYFPELRGRGLTRHTWERSHDDGILVPIHRHVSRVQGAPVTVAQTIRAATLAVGEGTLASHTSAAWLFGAPVAAPPPVHVVTANARKGHRRSDIVVHRPKDKADLKQVSRLDVPCTSPLRTMLDIGQVADPQTAGRVLDHFVVQRFVTVAALRKAVARHSARGRTGIGTVRLLLDEWGFADKPPDSILEVTFGRLLREHGLPSLAFHHRVATREATFELDFADLDRRLDVEIDGWAYHGDRRRFEADRRRDALLVAAGWRVLRFTWYQVVQEPDWVVARLREALGAT